MKFKFFYGYGIVASIFVIMAMIWGINSAFGVFFDSLLREFGWTRAMTSLAASFNNIIFGLVCIYTSRLTDRFGPRLVISVCAVVMSAGYYLLSLTTSLWQLYLFFGVIIPFGMSPYIPMLSLVARWFDKRRATMTAIVFIGMGTGTIAMPIIASMLISSYEWRYALVIISIISVVLFAIAAQFLRPAPEKTKPVQNSPEKLPAGPELTMRDAFRTRQFWLLCSLYFFFLYALISIMVHIVVHATGLGVSLSSAANSIAIIGGLCIVGMMIMGPTADRVGTRPALAISFAIMAVSMYWLMAAKNLWGIYLFAGIYGLSYGGMQILFSPSVAQLFGLKSHGTILGAAAFMGSVGAALGPFITGLIFDTNNNYTLAFLICALMGTTGVVLALLLRPVKGFQLKKL